MGIDLVLAKKYTDKRLKESGIKKYTVIFSGSNPAGVRVDDAVGMVANVAVDDEIVQNDFDSVSFFNRPICCGYHDANGKFHVNAYRGEPGFAFDGSNGEVFYECTPCGWNGSFDAPSVTGTPCEGYALFPNFKNWYEKEYYPVFWLSMVANKATSRSGTVPEYSSLNGHMDKARTYNTNAHTETMQAHMYEYVLQLIEFATRDLQLVMMGASTLSYNSATDITTVAETDTNRAIVTNATADKYVVGQSIVIGTTQNGSNIADRVIITSIEAYDATNKTMYFDGSPVNIEVGYFISSRAWKNGATDIIVASSGSPGSNTSGKYPCIWRGKVSPWADGFSVICSFLIQRNGAGTSEDPYTYTPYIINDPREYANGVITTDYTKLNYNVSPSDGYVKTLGVDSRFKFAALTIEVGASSTTFLAAYFYYPRYDICAVFVGGYWISGRFCSPVFFHCYFAPSDSSFNRLARLFVTRS